MSDDRDNGICQLALTSMASKKATLPEGSEIK